MEAPLVLLDLDGVVADFTGGVFRTFGVDLPRREWQWEVAQPCGFKDINDPDFWRRLENSAWWASLPTLSDGMTLVSSLMDMVEAGLIELAICSSSIVKGSSDGKREWIAEHLPSLAGRELFVTRKSLAAGPGKLLIDDKDSNVSDFNVGGGRAVLIPRPWNRAKSACLPDDGYSFDPAALLEQVKAELLDIVLPKPGRCLY